MPLCNARLRGERLGLRCRYHAKANGRCRRHGGNSAGPVTKAGLARTAAARNAGAAAWRKRMHEARALGIIEHVPWYGRGWKKNGPAQKPRPTLKDATLAYIDSELEKLPAVEKPLEQQTMGELLATNARKGLLRAHAILSIPCEDDNYKLMSLQKDIIATTITTQVRVDETAMRRQSADRLPELLKRIEAIKAEGVTFDQAAELVGFGAESNT